MTTKGIWPSQMSCEVLLFEFVPHIHFGRQKWRIAITDLETMVLVCR